MGYVAVVVAALLSLASADVYMQNPRGSNNKLNEVSNNVNNANRLFDSQYVSTPSPYHPNWNRSLSAPSNLLSLNCSDTAHALPTVSV